MKICLDIDDVLADWRGGIRRLFNYKGEFLSKNADVDIGIPMEEFWHKVANAKEDFWLNLDIYPHAIELYQACANYGEVILLTSPSGWKEVSPWASLGKILWIQHHFGPNFQDYLIGKPKHFCSHYESVLIDDTEANITKFDEHGGYGIVFPQNYNSKAKFAGDPMKYVLTRLKAISRIIHKDKN